MKRRENWERQDGFASALAKAISSTKPLEDLGSVIVPLTFRNHERLILSYQGGSSKTQELFLPQCTMNQFRKSRHFTVCYCPLSYINYQAAAADYWEKAATYRLFRDLGKL